MITIVLADDHRILREGLRRLLETEKDLKVLGEADSGRAAIDSVERLHPDVLVLDLSMPDLSGLDVAERLATVGTRMVVLSMHAGEAHVAAALRRGVLGYVLKDAGAEQLIRAIRAAAAGRRYLSPPLSEQAVQAFLAKSQGGAQRFEDLTHREQEVLLMSAQGLSANGVAQRLGISCRTVEVHRARAMGKLGLRDRFDLIRWAVRRGIVTPGPP